MTNEELKFFLDKVAKEYFKYLEKTQTSLLARIYGIYSVKIQGTQTVNVMLMAHTMQILNKERVKAVFDLKGSSVKRTVDCGNQKGMNKLKTLKDNNFRKMHSSKKPLVQLFASDRQFILSQIGKDTRFLRRLNIMDYSLLLCIENRGQKILGNDS